MKINDLIVLSLLVLSSGRLWANLEQFQMVNGNTQIVNFDGQVHAQKLQIETSSLSFESNGFEGYVETVEQTIHFQQHDQLISFKNFDQARWSFLRELRMVDSNVLWEKDHYINLSIPYLGVTLGDRYQYIEQLQAQCASNGNRSRLSAFLGPCLENAFLSTPRIDLDQLSLELVNEVFSDHGLQSLQQGPQPQFLGGDLRNVELVIKDGSYALNAQTRILFNVRLRLEGGVYYNQETNQLFISINRARAGIFSVKSRLLRSLRDKGVPLSGDTIVISF